MGRVEPEFSGRPSHGTPRESAGSLSIHPVGYAPWCSSDTLMLYHLSQYMITNVQTFACWIKIIDAGIIFHLPYLPNDIEKYLITVIHVGFLSMCAQVVGHVGKMSDFGYSDRRVKPRLHQYVVSLGMTIWIASVDSTEK